MIKSAVRSLKVFKKIRSGHVIDIIDIHVDVKTSFTFFIIFINAFFNDFYFWNVLYFLVEKFLILLNPLKSN